MTKPRWYSQPFPPAGSISAEGIKRTLGKPPIPWPAILVRESAQNSWDARLRGQSVGFVLDLAIVAPQHAHAWRSLLLEGAPHSEKFPLRQSLRGREWHSTIVRTLTISDRGTKGLGGPTRADTARGDAPRDWVSFVLNVGDPPDTKKGGGTYGYGKGILYQMSRAGTIIVHTRTATSDGAQNRLIGICLGESVELQDEHGHKKPYTGRHWWGHVEASHVEPLIDDEAVEVATALGLRPFRDNETGTDVVIVDPDFGDDSDHDTAQYLADAIAWNLWPIMLRTRGDDRMVAEVRHGGNNIPVPVPEKTLGLKTFVAAYQRLKEGGEDVRTLSCGNPKKPLGRLALERQLIPAYQPPAAAQDLGVTNAPHHVCLMRSPELVVKYHAGPEPISSNLAYGGVFRAFDDLDRVYAAAEPPTHDDWVFAQLEGPDRTYIRTTFVRLKEQLAEFARPADVKSEGVRAPLGAVSNFLGSLVAASSGSGAASAPFPASPSTSGPAAMSGGFDPADPEPGSAGRTAGSGSAGVPSGGSGSGRASVRLRGEPYFEDRNGGLLLVQDVVVHGNGRLVARGTAAITVADGTREQEPPETAGQPIVVGWRIDDRIVDGETIHLPNAFSGQKLSLLIEPVPDTVTEVDAISVRDKESSHGR